MRDQPREAAPGAQRASGAQLDERGHSALLWRHGQTVWNVEHRFQGRQDVPLDDTGRAQAERAARLLAGLGPDAVVASDLRRAADTAATLSRLAGVPVTLDPDLQERDMGAWEGLSHEEVEWRFPEQWAVRQPTDGETYEEVGDRVVAAVHRALEKVPAGGTLVVVSHGAALRSGMARLLDLPLQLWPRIGPLANGSWSLLGQGRGGWRLLEHNAGTLPEPVLSDDR